MGHSMFGDLFENLLQTDLGFPLCCGKRFAGVQNEPRNIIWTIGTILYRAMRTEAVVAPRSQLRQRHRVCLAAREIEELALRPALHLDLHHGSEIARMQCVANLESLTAKTKVLQRAPGEVRVDPVRKDSLFSSAKLSGSRQYTTAIDPERNLKTCGVLLCEPLTCQLGSTIKGDRSFGAEPLNDAGLPNPCGPRLPGIEHESR